MIARLKAVRRIALDHGLLYFAYLIRGWLLPRLIIHRRDHLLGRAVRRLSRDKSPSRTFPTSLHAYQGCAGTTFTKWSSFGVTKSVRSRVEAARRGRPGKELVLGRIDADGRLLGKYGELPGLPTVSSNDFRERHRFDLDIVLLGDSVLVRKDYRGDRTTLRREATCLALLGGKVNVPALHHVDESRTLLYRNLAPGRTLRDLLSAQGARILQAQTTADPSLRAVSQAARIEEVWARGREHLPGAVNEALLLRLESQLEAAHSQLVTGISYTWGNVVIDESTNTPWLIDLDKARIAASRDSIAFQLLRDDDRERFNKLYGRTLLTETSARAALAEQSAKFPGWYAPIDFGMGLSVGSFWTTGSGTGRWAYLNGPALASMFPGKRVLDLGSNNGVMPLMMLRSGAREVVGVEFDPAFGAAARLVHRIFEWRDGTRYPFRIHIGNMLDIVHADWGKFDIVTAYCSLYYLSPDDMIRVVQRAADLAPVIVLQAKTDTRREALENKAEKSSLEYLKALLQRHGFLRVDVFAPAGYTRPLLVGYRT